MRSPFRGPGMALLVPLLGLAALTVPPLGAQEPAAPTLEIVQPGPGEPLLGAVEIEVRVQSVGTGSEPLELEAFLDGESLGLRHAPPWRWQADVGPRMREHRIQVVARGETEELHAARTTPTIRIDDRLEAELQTLYVTVERGKERVSNLPRSAFRISDQGRPQTLVTFEHGDLPLTAALLLDTSVSMEGERLDAAVAGARAFLDGLRPLDEARVMAFSDRLRFLSRDLEGIADLAALEALEATAGTAIHDHLFLALHLLEARPGRRVAVLLSDGVDWHSVLPVDEVERLARRSQALLYWVRLDGAAAVTRYNIAPGALSTPKEKLGGFHRLEKIVRESGGRIVRLHEPGEIEAAYRDILQELRDQYALGYYPRPELRHDGTWREIEVEVGTPGLAVRTCAGYLDRAR